MLWKTHHLRNGDLGAAPGSEIISVPEKGVVWHVKRQTRTYGDGEKDQER